MGSETTGRRFRQGTHGQVSPQRAFDDFVFRKGINVEIWRPSWKNTYTTVRFLPAINPEDGQTWDPYRMSDADNDFGDWIRTYPAIRNVGHSSKCTYLLYDPTNTSYDPASNPTIVFYRNLHSAIKSGRGQGHWVPMIDGGQDRGADLPEPGEITIAQCLLYQHDSKIHDPPRGWAEEDKQVVLEMSISAKYALYEKLNERSAGPQTSTTDYASIFAAGDVVSLEHGKFIRFCQEGSSDEANLTQRQPMRMGMARRESGGRRKARASYECHVVDTFNGFAPQLDDHSEYLKSRWQPWDRILRFLSDAEQVRELAARFPPDMVTFAFRDQHRQLVPDYVWAQERERVSTGYLPADGAAAAPPARPSSTLRRSPGVPQGAAPAPLLPAGPTGAVDPGLAPEYPEVGPVEAAPPLEASAPVAQPPELPGTTPTASPERVNSMKRMLEQSRQQAANIRR